MSDYVKKDITLNVEQFINKNAMNNKEENVRDKLLATLQFIKTNSIRIMYVYDKLQNDLSIQLLLNNDIIGTFEIQKLGNKNSMGINIDDEINDEFYRNKGLARLMIASIIYVLVNTATMVNKNIILSKLSLLYIDTDASAGFWDKIGMTESRLYSRRGYGYEKEITLRDLASWCLGNNAMFMSGGKMKTNKRKTNKRKTNKRKTNKRIREKK